jgi:hypothetical protein
MIAGVSVRPASPGLFGGRWKRGLRAPKTLDRLTELPRPSSDRVERWIGGALRRHPIAALDGRKDGARGVEPVTAGAPDRPTTAEGGGANYQI